MDIEKIVGEYQNRYTSDEVKADVAQILLKPFSGYSEKESIALVISLMDLTTLEGSDTTSKVQQLCRKAASFSSIDPSLSNAAAVCVYPTLVSTAKKELADTGIYVASVAGAFPAGQSPINIKIDEVKYAIREGADEIDMVISRGKFLEKNYREVAREIAMIKEACGKIHLKVILETGELPTLNDIAIASDLAIMSGADFIKTSTGKIPQGASLEAVYVMLKSVKNHFEKTGKIIGVKPSGGIADVDTAISYLKLVKYIAGDPWLKPQNFRFGASRLADDAVSKLQTTKS